MEDILFSKKQFCFFSFSRWQYMPMAFLIFMGSLSFGQSVATQTFSANGGYDSSNTTLSVNSSDINVNEGQPIQSISIYGFTYSDEWDGDETYGICDDEGEYFYYAFDLTVTGGVSDGLTINEGCTDDFIGISVTGFSGISVTVQDVDDYSDWVESFNLILEVTYETPSCPAPTGLTASTTATSATLGWTGTGDFDLKWGTSGFDVETEGTLVPGAPNPYDLSELTTGAAYQFYVRQDCGGGEVSDWAGPVSFVPNSFKVIGTGTSNTNGTGNDPIDDYYSSMHYQTVYTAAELTAAGFVAYNELTGLGFSVSEGTNTALLNYQIRIGHTTASNAAASINSSDLTTVRYPVNYLPTVVGADQFDMLDFDANFVWNGVDNIVIDICTGGSNPYSSPYGGIRVHSLANGSRFVRADTSQSQCGVNTTTANSNRPQVQFSYIEGTPPACPAPAGLTASNITSGSADLSWASDGDTFDISWGEGTFDAENGTIVNGFEIGETLSGLSASATYQYYVRQDCGGGDTSDWAGPYSFTTPCNSTSVPYIQDFQSAAVPNLPDCTLNQNVGSGNNWVTENYTSATGGFLGKVLRYGYNSTYAANTWFYTQGIELEADIAYIISYDYGNVGSYPERMKVAYGTSAVNTAMTNILADHPNISGGALQNNEVIFTPSATGVYYFGFNAYSTADQNRLNLDNIKIDFAPSCTAPTGVTLGNVDGHTADFSWNTIDNAEGYNWYVYENDADPESATPVATGNTADTSVTVINLDPETAYDFYVETNCGIEDGVSELSTKVDFTTTVTCPAPTGLTASNITTGSADLSWTSGGDTFDISWGEGSFDAENGTIVNGFEIGETLSGLSASTTYQYYVRQDCGGGDTSDWAGPYGFTTMCGAADIPYIEDFTDATVPGMPSCTTIENAGSGNDWVTTSGSDLTGKYLKYGYNSANPANAWFYTAGLNLQAGTTYEITYRYKVGLASYAENLKVAVGTSASSTAMNTLLADHPGLVNTIAQTGKAYFTPASSGVYYFGFNCYSAADKYNLYVDDISVALPDDIVWTLGGEWSNFTGPDPSDDVLVVGGLDIGADAANLEVNNLMVLSSGSITVPAGNTLTVNGAIANNAGAAGFLVENGGNLIQHGTAANTGAITVKRNSTPMIRLDYTLWSSPVTGQNLFDFSPETVNGVTNYDGSEGRIYIYDGTNGYVHPDPFEANTVMNNGAGYLFRSPNNWNATEEAAYEGVFTGVPFNGNKTVSAHAGDYTSIGNPYPSNISVNSLMSANTDIATLYFWNNNHGDGNNYATCTNGVGCTAASGGGDTPNGTIAVGQGFIVGTSGSSVTFNNDMRVDDNGSFFKVDELESHRMWLNLNGVNEEKYNQVLVGYVGNATNGVDNQIDGAMFGYQGSALYSLIDGQQFVIQGRALPFEVSDVVPLGFRAAENGKFTVSLANFDGVFAEGNVTIYLRDNQLHVIHNLMESDYDFESAAGEFNERFDIIYGDEGTMGTSDLASGNVLIYKYDHNIVVESKSEKILSVELFDLQGRNLFRNEKVNANVYQIRSASFGTQVLVVRVQTHDGVIETKKVINN